MPALPRVLALLLAASIAVSAGVAAAEHVTQERSAVAAQRPGYDVARDALTSRRGEALQLVGAAQDAVTAGAKVLADSAGKVLDGDGSRATLEDELRRDTFKVQTGEAEQRLVDAAAKAKPAAGPYGPDYAAAARVIDQLQYPVAQQLRTVPVELGQLAANVTAAEAAWQAEQARIAAEKAREAAAAAAAAAAYTANNSIYVWTSSNGPDVQSKLDACRGGVNVSSYFGTGAVAIHDYCGGDGLDKNIGTKYTLTGEVSGTFQVVGILHVNGYTTHIDDLPHQYSLLVQTCIGRGYGDMIEIELNRV
ncbi:hypothetical protein ACRAWC_01780 [Leifsonia sp. L25]|uniref:hypothetical protein n=1 Tax=Actinomycetes TaxID=1760 RepID=UPI003D69354B